ncbi:hypothetical protein HYQ46_002452 [Verticillium longisporum]|nr:hypothetical protein HYQ46_002452 [Verticillium longisporum]
MTAILAEATEFKPYGTTEACGLNDWLLEFRDTECGQDGLRHEVRVPPTQIVDHVSHVKSNDKKNYHSTTAALSNGQTKGGE